jgi:hypothetical protein
MTNGPNPYRLLGESLAWSGIRLPCLTLARTVPGIVELSEIPGGAFGASGGP